MIDSITLKDCIEFAVKTEELGARFYSRMSNKFSNEKEVAEIFGRLSKDEKTHQQQFSALLNNLPEEKGITDAPEKHEYVRAMSISEFFSHNRGPFKNVDEIKDRDDALEKALNFEKATLGFYQAVQDLMVESNALKAIMEAEKEHIAVLMKVLMTGAKFRSLQDKWYAT